MSKQFSHQGKNYQGGSSSTVPKDQFDWTLKESMKKDGVKPHGRFRKKKEE